MLRRAATTVALSLAVTLTASSVTPLVEANILLPSVVSRHHAHPSQNCWGCIPRGGSDSGSSSKSLSSYATQLEAVKSQVLQSASSAIDGLRKQIVDQGQVVADFGAAADEICNQALQEFATQAPAAPDAAAAAAYDRALEHLEAAVDAPLQVLYLKLLGHLREEALQSYRSNSSGGSNDYEAMRQADAAFCQAAEAASRDSNVWDYQSERSFLQAVLSLQAESASTRQQVQLQAAQQSQTAMQFLQSQQQMIQQLQMQLYGQSSPWNVGIAYRIPDTNFNLQGSYQQGRANLQLSCVPDEYAPFLGPNGFTNGVGPGNLGLSLNLSI